VPLSKRVCRSCLQQERTRVQDDIARMEGDAGSWSSWAIATRRTRLEMVESFIRRAEDRNRKFKHCPMRIFAKDKKRHCKFRLEQVMAEGLRR
jgi:hypothetical protein